MGRISRPTAFARLSTRQARTVFAAAVVLSGLFVAVTLSPLANPGPSRESHDGPGAGDVALYRATIDRIHAGEGYYEVAGAEMRARGYPTGSVFNWRVPTPFWLIGWMPSVTFGKVLLGGLALALSLLAFEALAREEDNAIRRPVACALLLTGPLLPCVLGDLFVMPSLWAGVLIALSICAYGVDRPRLGVVCGLAAVFLRELAMPYCLVAAALAWRNKRRGELTAWLVGLAGFTVIFGLHALHVSGLIGPEDRLHRESWVQFGGTAFVIATAEMTAYLLLLPQWITALYLAAALLGFAGWNTPLGRRAGLTACLFVIAFAVVGQPFNQYWGSLIAPLLCFGVVRSPGSLRDLWKAAATSSCSAAVADSSNRIASSTNSR